MTNTNMISDDVELPPLVELRALARAREIERSLRIRRFARRAFAYTLGAAIVGTSGIVLAEAADAGLARALDRFGTAWIMILAVGVTIVTARRHDRAEVAQLEAERDSIAEGTWTPPRRRPWPPTM